MQHISGLDAITVFAVDSSKFAVTASGKVLSTGWTNPRLSSRFCVEPPADGILDMDFYANQPTGIVLPMPSHITTALVINRDPANYWGKGKPLEGVRVHAATNKLEANYDAENRQQGVAMTDEAIETPLPLAIRAARVLGNIKFEPGSKSGPKVDCNASICELLSKNLRVYRSGDSLGPDYRTDRANIELDPQSLRIVDAWVG